MRCLQLSIHLSFSVTHRRLCPVTLAPLIHDLYLPQSVMPTITKSSACIFSSMCTQNIFITLVCYLNPFERSLQNNVPYILGYLVCLCLLQGLLIFRRPENVLSLLHKVTDSSDICNNNNACTTNLPCKVRGPKQSATSTYLSIGSAKPLLYFGLSKHTKLTDQRR